MKEIVFEGFKKGHVFLMPDTWIWVKVIDVVNFVITEDSFGIGNRSDNRKDDPCSCVLLGEYEDKFLLRYLGHNSYIQGKTYAPDGIVFMLPQKYVLEWDKQIIEQNKNKKIINKALKRILTEG